MLLDVFVKLIHTVPVDFLILVKKCPALLLYKFGSLQLKMLIDLGVGFKDSKGRNKVILTILLEIMYSV